MVPMPPKGTSSGAIPSAAPKQRARPNVEGRRPAAARRDNQ